jgi:hypothetical protein
MNGRRRNFLPSIADVIFLGIFLFLASGGDGRLLGDADTGYHIRAGEFMIENYKIPDADIFSFLTPALPWTLHEWFAQVIMALAHRLANITGIVILFSFLIALSGYLVFTLLLNQRANLIFASIAALLVTFSSASNWLARPHIFTFLLFIVWYHLLNHFQYRERNHLVVLPLIMVAWVNLHGGFILGLILLGIYLVGNFTQSIFATPSDRGRWLHKAGQIGWVMIACVMVALLNPYGYDSLLFPVRVVQDKFLMDSIAEYLSPNFHSNLVLPFELLLLSIIAIFAVSGSKADMIELGLIVLFAHMALFSSRHIPLFAFVAGPILVKHAQLAFDQMDRPFIAALKQRLENLAVVDQSTVPFLWPAVALIIALALVVAGAIKHDFDGNYVPTKAVAFIQRESITGNMFNNDEFGDYVIYAAWPRYRVFIDGRTDMYGATRVKEYLTIARAQNGWESLMEKYQLTWVFHEPTSVLSRILLERADWKLVYSDKVANIFVKSLPQYQTLITKYGATRPYKEKSGYTN